MALLLAARQGMAVVVAAVLMVLIPQVVHRGRRVRQAVHMAVAVAVQLELLLVQQPLDKGVLVALEQSA